jgi:hypothetical protein
MGSRRQRAERVFSVGRSAKVKLRGGVRCEAPYGLGSEEGGSGLRRRRDSNP